MKTVRILDKLKRLVSLHTCVIIILHGIVSSQRVQYLGIGKYAFTNGRNGTCTLQKYIGEETNIVCNTGFKSTGNLQSTPTQQLPLKPTCKFYTSYNIYQCFENGPNKLETCNRTLMYYYGNINCLNAWMPWDRCSKSCGTGFQSRVKFTTNKMQTRTRECNAIPCPDWSDWLPEINGGNITKCDLYTCTRKWTRECMFNNKQTSIDKCNNAQSITFKIPGYQYIDSKTQRRPCAPEECIKPTTAKPNVVTTIPQTTTIVVTNTTVAVNTTSSVIGGIEGRIELSSKSNNNSDVPNHWQIIGIVAMLMLLLLVLIGFLGTRTKFKKYLRHKTPRIIVNDQAREHFRNGWFVSRTGTPLNSSPTANTSGAQSPPQPPDSEYLSPQNLQETLQVVTSMPILPPPLPNSYTQAAAEIDTSYSMVTCDQTKEYESQRATKTPCEKRSSTASSSLPEIPASAKEEDPIYSDIPAYSAVDRVEEVNNQTKLKPSAPLFDASSSDFDTDYSDNSMTPPSHRVDLLASSYKKEEDDRIENGEERDVVRTLNRKKRSGSEQVRRSSYDSRFKRSKSYTQSMKGESTQRYSNRKKRQYVDNNEEDYRRIYRGHESDLTPLNPRRLYGESSRQQACYPDHEICYDPRYEEEYTRKMVPLRNKDKMMKGDLSRETFSSRTSDYHSARDSESEGAGSMGGNSLEQYYQQSYRYYDRDDDDDYDDFPPPPSRPITRTATERLPLRDYSRAPDSDPFYRPNRTRHTEKRRPANKPEPTHLRSKSGKIVLVDESCYSRPKDTRPDQVDDAYSTYSVPFQPESKV